MSVDPTYLHDLLHIPPLKNQETGNLKSFTNRLNGAVVTLSQSKYEQELQSRTTLMAIEAKLHDKHQGNNDTLLFVRVYPTLMIIESGLHNSATFSVKMDKRVHLIARKNLDPNQLLFFVARHSVLCKCKIHVVLLYNSVASFL
jgi:hypothetical protein